MNYQWKNEDMSIKSKIIKTLHTITSSVSTKFTINKEIGEFGKMLDLKFDKINKSIKFVIDLKGEDKPLEVNIEKYKIVSNAIDDTKNTSSEIEIISASTGKEWINAIIKNFVIGKSFPIPNKYVNLIEDFLD